MSADQIRASQITFTNLGSLEDEQVGFIVPPKEFGKQADAGFPFQNRLDLGEDSFSIL